MSEARRLFHWQSSGGQQGKQTMYFRGQQTQAGFVSQLHWHITMLICLCIAYGYFLHKTADMSSFDRDSISCKA